jgi:hypothetical protein
MHELLSYHVCLAIEQTQPFPVLFYTEPDVHVIQVVFNIYADNAQTHVLVVFMYLALGSLQ